jgi:hypothetical protein
MSRTHWLLVSAWAFLIGCCLIAGIVTYLQVTWRLQTSRENSATRRQTAFLEQQLRMSEQQRQDEARHLLAKDSVNEDAEFLRQLQRLIAESGSKAEQIQSVPLSLLPDIRTVRPTDTVDATRPADEQRIGSPITHLPLNIRARSTQVVLTGSLVEIHRFLTLLTQYSITALRINTNSIHLDRNGNTLELRAILIVTRFIRPIESSTNAAGQ